MASWRLSVIVALAFYAAAALLVVVLPLHMLEHLSLLPGLAQPMRPIVLYLLLVAAGIHGSIGLRNIIYDYTGSPLLRRIGAAASLLLGAAIIAVGLAGLLKITPLSP